MEEQESYPNSELISWNFNEYDPEPRSNTWYLWFGIFIAGLVIYAVISNNILFAVILILFSIIVFLQNWRKPAKIHFGVTPNGITIADKFYKMSEIQEFWIAYDPPRVKAVFFQFTSPFKPLLGIPLDAMDPLQLRKILLDYIPENLDREDEPIPDAIARVLRF